MHQQPSTRAEYEPDHASPGLTRGRRMLVLAGCAVLGTVIGVTGQELNGGGSSTSSAPSAVAVPTATAQITVTSFDPKKGGSGFRKEGDSWRTQSYTSATFGSLKPGVGLVLDLGSAKPLSAVTVEAVNGPLTVELRAGDTLPTSATSLPQVGAPAQATGSTTLPAGSGGSHRYWMIWVTGLAPADGGFSAVLRNPTARPAA
jgi:hypothetical protein